MGTAGLTPLPEAVLECGVALPCGTAALKTAAEKQAWSDTVEATRPYDNEEKKEWFIGVCQEVGIDPASSTLFDYLEADDKLIGKA